MKRVKKEKEEAEL
jgi:hypothetical protein